MRNFNWRGAAKGFAIASAALMTGGAFVFAQWQLMDAFGVWAGAGLAVVVILGIAAWCGSKSATG